MRGGWISARGPFVERFERRFAVRFRAKHALTTTSGTTALHLALASLGVGPKSEVILPDFTMVACVNAVLYTGATPVFVDVDPATWTLDPAQVRERVNPSTSAIMPVHLYGHPADMGPLLRISQDWGVPLVEDAAEAHGATYRGKVVGSIGTIGCFSFYSNKLMTTGEGGMLTTNSHRLAREAALLRDLAFAHKERDYHHSRLAYNYRMSSLQAALGLAQLDRLPASVRHHRECARIYNEFLSGVEGLDLPQEAGWARSVYWLYTIRVRRGKRGRARLMKDLLDRGIETRVGFWPLHRQPFCSRYSGKNEQFSISDRLGRETLSLPSGNGVSESDVMYVAKTVRGLMTT